MSRIKLDGWKCDYEDCGHVWIKKSNVPPKQCAKCRRWGWDSTVSPAQKTMQDKLSELPPDRQEKIKKLTAQKKSKASKIESIERMAEEADRDGLYDKVLVPDPIADEERRASIERWIEESEASVQILDSVSADLPTVSEPKI